MKRLVRCFFLPFCWVAPLASVQAVDVRVATFNIQNGPLAPGTDDYAATKAVLARMDADIVAFQEVLSDSRTNCIPNWQQMGAELGYAHVKIGTAASGIQRLAYFSRYTISQATDIESTWPASEMTRRPMRVVVQVPGAAKPLVIWNMHHKADEPNADDVAAGNRNNQFRRAIEAYRIVRDIDTYRSANPGHDEFLVMGDLNDDVFQAGGQDAETTLSEYNSFRGNSNLLPSSFVLGSDISFPVAYAPFPDGRYALAGGGLHRLDLRQQNPQERATRGSRTLDYIFVSSAIRDSSLGAPRGEVYESQWEAVFAGFPKAGVPLAADTSTRASDHRAVFADIHMDNAMSVTLSSFSPAVGAPGATVTINGGMLGRVTSVRFGGVAANFTVSGETQITATIPSGAVSGPISVSGPDGNASSAADFMVAVLPAVSSAVATPRALADFATIAGSASPPRTFSVSAGALRAPLGIDAPPGFQVSLDGTNYASAVQIAAPARSDAAANYTATWVSGSTAGKGFKPWVLVAERGSGDAAASFGNPAGSQITNMGTKAFALQASPAGSGAFVDAIRELEQPLAAGEALSFDWGINWDSNTSLGAKGFALKSGPAIIATVQQGNFPGPITLSHLSGDVATGLEYGTSPMRWTFRQLDARTLSVTATARTNRSHIAYSNDIPVPGAVSAFMWFAEAMDSDILRRSYYDNVAIDPVFPGGGAISPATIWVRLAATALAGGKSGSVNLTSDGQELAAVQLDGTVFARPAIPVISSVLAARGEVGASFNYRITAGNSPTSYGASHLPGGLSIDKTSGLISGTPAAAGKWNVLLSASNSGGGGSALLALSVAPGVQRISFTQPARQVFAPRRAFQLVASNSAPLPVEFVSANTNILFISNNVATIRAAGTVVVTATNRGAADYKAAGVSRTVTIDRGSQTIPRFVAVGNVPFNTVLTFSNTNSTAGLPVVFQRVSGPVTVSSNRATITGVGEVVLRAVQNGDANCNPAPVLTNRFMAVKANQVITFTNLPKVVAYRSNGVIPLGARSSSGLPVTYTSRDTNILRIVGATALIKRRGTNTVTASHPGNAYYNPAPGVGQSIVIK